MKLSVEQHQKFWDATNWTPHTLQRNVLLNGARNKVVSAGRRAGKSQMGGHALVPVAFDTLGRMDSIKAAGLRDEYWIV